MHLLMGEASTLAARFLTLAGMLALAGRFF